MKCKNCDNELTGRQKNHCSDRCRKALSRTSKSDIPNPDTKVGQTRTGTHPATHAEHLEFYYANPDRYATRTNPDKLNWGPLMTMDQLEQAGLKANRVSIPGDWDFGEKRVG